MTLAFNRSGLARLVLEHGTEWSIAPARLAALSIVAADTRAARGAPPPKPTSPRGVSILNLSGIVVQHPSWLTELGIGTSTEAFARDFNRAMNDTTTSAILISVNSPGGTVPGTAELANTIYRARGRGKRIVAMSNSLMASAAYWIGSAADRVAASVGSDTGSVGVYVIHENFGAALEAEGIETTIIQSAVSPRKTEGHPFGPLDDEARRHFQTRVDRLGQSFVSDVAKFRNVPEATVKQDFGQGRSLLAREALAAGVVDGIMSAAELYGVLASGRNIPTFGQADIQRRLERLDAYERKDRLAGFIPKGAKRV